MFKRVCTFRQIVLLFNYHIITHAAYLDEKIPVKAKVSKLFKGFVILICYEISNVGINLNCGKKNPAKSKFSKLYKKFVILINAKLSNERTFIFMDPKLPSEL